MFEHLYVYTLLNLYIKFGICPAMLYTSIPFLWLGTMHHRCLLITMVILDVVRWMWILDLPVS